MFTKEQIKTMKEAEFQDSVLIPLFRAMGFKDVTAWGGGSLELGKDIVMWKEGDVGERVNYGVVVKAVRITGKAKGNNTALEVLNQVRQTLTSEYADPVTGRKHRVQRCFVVSSEIIKKTAINSIETILADGHFDKLLTWIHPGTNLFELIDKYLPEQGVFEKLADIQNVLDEAMKIVPYRIVADSDKKFSILPKNDKATEEMPFIIKSKFKFDTTTIEGREAHDKFIDHFEKGTPVEIDGTFIESFQLPDFIPDFLKPQISKDSKLVLEPVRPDLRIPLRFERTLADGKRVSSGTLNFQIVQRGTEEITLKNDKQEGPLKATLVINLGKKLIRFTFDLTFFGFNVFQHLQGLQFFTAMSQDGETNVYREDIGVKIIGPQLEKMGSRGNFDSLIELLKALVLIQERTGTLLTYPQTPPTDQEIDDIFEAAEIIRNGKLVGTSSEIRADVSLDNAKKSINMFKNEAIIRIFNSYSEGTKYNILGSQIDLGVGALTADAFIKENDFDEIKKRIRANQEMIEFILRPKDNAVIIDFLKWECEDRPTRILISERR